MMGVKIPSDAESTTTIEAFHARQANKPQRSVSVFTYLAQNASIPTLYLHKSKATSLGEDASYTMVSRIFKNGKNIFTKIVI